VRGYVKCGTGILAGDEVRGYVKRGTGILAGE
jgi:hypothetical protein